MVCAIIYADDRASPSFLTADDETKLSKGRRSVGRGRAVVPYRIIIKAGRGREHPLLRRARRLFDDPPYSKLNSGSRLKPNPRRRVRRTRRQGGAVRGAGQGQRVLFLPAARAKQVYKSLFIIIIIIIPQSSKKS